MGEAHRLGMDTNFTARAEALNARRYALSHKTAAIHAKWLALSQAKTLKKGDVVYVVHSYGDGNGSGVTTVVARASKLTSFGKRQGTATYVGDATNLSFQLYRNSSLILSTKDEVNAYAAEIGNLYAEAACVGHAYCSLANSLLRQDLWVKRELEVADRLVRASNPMTVVEFKEGGAL